MKLSEWIEPYLSSHQAAFGIYDWPRPGSEEFADFVNMFIDAFHDHGISQDEATRATRKLGPNPPKWGRDHLPAILATVKGMRELRGHGNAELSRDSAMLASKDCGHCGGGGLAIVYLKSSIDGKPVTCGSHCICAHGRWMRNQIRKQSADDLARIPDLAFVLTGNSRWCDDESFHGIVFDDDEAAAAFLADYGKRRDFHERIARHAG